MALKRCAADNCLAFDVKDFGKHVAGDALFFPKDGARFGRLVGLEIFI
jgi:hypothetical protein